MVAAATNVAEVVRYASRRARRVVRRRVAGCFMFPTR
jgi:hypothetical protein